MDQNDYIPSSSIEFYVANCLIRLVYIATYAELLVFSIQRLLKRQPAAYFTPSVFTESLNVKECFATYGLFFGSHNGPSMMMGFGAILGPSLVKGMSKHVS
jgi:hypothetical protein